MTNEELKERGRDIKVLPHKQAEELTEIPLQDKLQDIKPVREGKAMPEVKRQLIWKIWDYVVEIYSGGKSVAEFIKSIPKGADLIWLTVIVALLVLLAYLTKGG